MSVGHWIDNVIFTNRMQGLYVVHMNESSTMFTIDLLKVKPATFTGLCRDDAGCKHGELWDHARSS